MTKLANRVDHLLNQLEPTERRFIELKYFEGKKSKEIINKLFYFKPNLYHRTYLSHFCSAFKVHVLNKLRCLDNKVVVDNE